MRCLVDKTPPQTRFLFIDEFFSFMYLTAQGTLEMVTFILRKSSGKAEQSMVLYVCVNTCKCEVIAMLRVITVDNAV